MIKLDKSNSIMKMLIGSFGVLSLLLFFSCDPDTGVLDNVVDAPPMGTVVEPSGRQDPNFSLMNQEFEVVVALTDGTVTSLSPLAGGEVSITDASDAEVVNSGPIGLSGTVDTLRFTVLANTLDTGTYTVTARITDTANLETELTAEMEVNFGFAFNSLVFFSGDPNMGALDQMELIADNTWQFKAANFATVDDGFEIVGRPEDGGCDWGADAGVPPPHGLGGTMIQECPGTSGNQPWVPGVIGARDIVFNDETFETEVKLSFASNNNELYMKGAFNGWSNDNPLELVADNTWEATDITIDDGQGFKIANTPDWSDCDYGAASGGSADIGLTGNLVQKCPGEDTNQDAIFQGGSGTYTFTFNDDDLSYSFE